MNKKIWCVLKLSNVSWLWYNLKGQLISKANCQAINSSKKRTNEFIFTTMRHVFVHFLEDIEDTKKNFRNYQTFSKNQKETVFLFAIFRLHKIAGSFISL